MTDDTKKCPACANFTATLTAKKKWSCPCGASGVLIKTSFGEPYMAVLQRPARAKEKDGG